MFIDKEDLGTIYLILSLNLELYKKEPTMFKCEIDRLNRVCTKIEDVLNGKTKDINIDTIIDKCNSNIEGFEYQLNNTEFDCTDKEQYDKLISITKSIEKYHSTVGILKNIRRGLL